MDRCILAALAFILFTLLMGVRIVFIARNNKDVAYLVKTYVVFAVCASILLLIFGPKVWELKKENKDQRANVVER